MARLAIGCILFLCGMLMACGPETIMVRPSLDTPAHHVTNGDILLKQGKIAGALREFQRANELAPDNVSALIGLSKVYSRLGDAGRAKAALDQAAPLAASESERCAIQEAYRQLQRNSVSPD
jgi:Flp pilus assembly protein TadD